MNEPNKIEFHWHFTFGAIAKLAPSIALAIGMFGISEAPAQSMPEPASDSWQIAQVGVRSRAVPPTPLNLRPQTHIPLPTNSRSRDYYRHSGYRQYGSYDRYGYGHHHDHHHHHRPDRHRRRGPVIIINPATSSSYSNYSSQDGYIRVIRNK